MVRRFPPRFALALAVLLAVAGIGTAWHRGHDVPDPARLAFLLGGGAEADICGGGGALAHRCPFCRELDLAALPTPTRVTERRDWTRLRHAPHARAPARIARPPAGFAARAPPRRARA